MREFKINVNDANQRVDKFVQKTCTNLPKNLMFRFIRQKKIKVNRKRCEPNQMLTEGDIVLMFISEEFFSEKKLDLHHVKKLTEILYEDENILVIDKQVGEIVHSDDKHETGLIDRILKYLVETNQYDPQKENSFIPALVNRLDVNTGGIVMACKNAKALRYINESIKQQKIEKHYVCIIEGKLKDQRYEHFYVKDEKANKGMIFDTYKEKSKPVCLETKTLHIGKNYSLVDIHLITGKSHQIRAQLAHLNHPLIGDVKYHGKNMMKHQALYAYKLLFHLDDENFTYLNHLKIEQNRNFVTQKYKELENVEPFK